MENIKNFEIIEDLRQSHEYGKYMESIGWRVITIPNSKFQIFIRKIGPVGIAKLQRIKGVIPLGNIEKILIENNVMMIKIEPLGDMIPLGYRLSGWPLLGTKTLRVDLRPSEEEIFNSFKKDCRYCIRQAQRLKGSKAQGNNFDLFYEIWKMSAKRKNLWIPKEKEYKSLVSAFGKNIYCLTVENLAGALVLVYKKTAFYYFAGSATEGTRMNLPYLVVWEAMREAKKRGCMVWDFEGIFDPRWPNKGWQGFSHFKKSFGGKDIEFPGSFEKWRWPF
jgi:hypothetical protein